jgi:hypothetical protein
MTTRVEQLAAELEALNEQVIALVMGCSSAQWQQPCGPDERPFGVVAHHIAEVNRDFAAIVAVLAAGGTYSPASSLDDVQAENARHAQAHQAVGRAQTLELLRANGAEMAQLLRTLDDAQLERVAGTFGGHQLTVQQVVEWIVIGHTREHLASLQAAIGDANAVLQPGG